MEFVPVIFKLERRSMLPILTITGICKNTSVSHSFLLGKAVSIIELSQNEFEGKLINLMGDEEKDVGITEGMIAVRFYIIFKNEQKLELAVTKIRKELG